MFYDAYKSNYVKKNGMPDEPFLLNSHPIWYHHPEHVADTSGLKTAEGTKELEAWVSQRAEFNSYKTLGEKKYLENYGNKFKEKLANKENSRNLD